MTQAVTIKQAQDRAWYLGYRDAKRRRVLENPYAEQDEPMGLAEQWRQGNATGLRHFRELVDATTMALRLDLSTSPLFWCRRRKTA